MLTKHKSHTIVIIITAIKMKIYIGQRIIWRKKENLIEGTT